jgi:hypothetical protein
MQETGANNIRNNLKFFIELGNTFHGGTNTNILKVLVY